MRITAKGQVTIPQDVRERAGLMPGTDVEFQIEAGCPPGQSHQNQPPPNPRPEGSSKSLRGHGDFRMTTAEVVALMPGPAADEA